MSFRQLRKLLLVIAVGALGVWLYKTRPTVSGLVDEITGPLFKSKAAVKESEYKRVVADAVPAISQSEEVALGTLHEGMKDNEVRDLIGAPDQIDSVSKDGVEQVRWIYKRLGRTLLLEERRVVSISVR
ncbi:MAG TPA: hypothetical protein VF376_08575 [Thermoanaerobaculia bacterium]